MFSTLDLQCGYWQLPVHPVDRDKTAFSPGAGMGLFQVCRMPFGFSGAPASFQRLMDKVCRGLPFIITYLNDVLVHSASMQEQAEHLCLVFELSPQLASRFEVESATLAWLRRTTLAMCSQHQYAYHTVVHSSTGFTSFELKFGCTPQKPVLHSNTTHDPSSHHDQLVETCIAENVHHQKTSFDRHA